MYYYYVVAFSILLFLFLFIKKISIDANKEKMELFLSNKTFEQVKHFEFFMVVLNFYQEKAFNLIYKDRIFIYSLEGTRINNEIFDVVVKDYINLVLKLMGPNLIREFEFFFGDRETFYFNLSEYFNTKVENDEIFKQALDNLTNVELPSELSSSSSSTMIEDSEKNENFAD